ncbi:MAG: GNAT family N-acetyltransferase, partial [Salinivirgaceae bacterium]|nr:GNAT family N-acetyltransferase [Salinivirgaceae bacterium]
MTNQEIENIQLELLTLADYEALKEAMIESYSSLSDAYWKESRISKLVTSFPEGQVVIKVDGQLAACALSIIVDYDLYSDRHTYKQITKDYTFNSHTDDGDVLYGIDVFVKPEFRGLRLGRRLYDYRKELCENLNLKGIVFGGRIPNYHKFSDELTPKQYIDKVKMREIEDPVLNFQMSNDFHPSRVLKGYLPGDSASNEYAVLLKWDNIYFEKPEKRVQALKTIVRLGLIQWQMRLYKNVDELMQQVEYFVDAVSGYKCDFALFPEFFNAPLMAKYNDLSESDAIRKLAGYTERIVEQFA